LIASFKATLEETVNADLLLHIVDVSNLDALKQIGSVKKGLEELGCAKRPILVVLNKVDIVKKISELEMLETLFRDAVCISAKTGLGLEQLSEAVMARYKGAIVLLRVSSSQSNGKVQSFLRAYGTIVNEHYLDGSVLIDARLGRNQLPGLKRLQPDNLEILQS
jgi:GTP-binding protein HflX